MRRRKEALDAAAGEHAQKVIASQPVLMLLRQSLAVLLLPVLVAVVIPLQIIRRRALVFHAPDDALAATMVVVGFVTVALGLWLFAVCLFYFWSRGRGTLAPWDPPRRFVAEGPYRFVRNPMITGVVLVLVGEACLMRAPALAEWAAFFVLVNVIYIPLVEEPMLKTRFGPPYERYLQTVPRFLPHLWRRSDGTTLTSRRACEWRCGVSARVARRASARSHEADVRSSMCFRSLAAITCRKTGSEALRKTPISTWHSLGHPSM